MKTIREDWECPTSCGECCYNPKIKACRPLINGWCKHHAKKGCRLSRGKRPWQCRDYLCGEVIRNTPEYHALSFK